MMEGAEATEVKNEQNSLRWLNLTARGMAPRLSGAFARCGRRG
jgi:hypothetical protein